MAGRPGYRQGEWDGTRIHEGQCITFPANIKHRSPVNDTDQQKVIISFNSNFYTCINEDDGYYENYVPQNQCPYDDGWTDLYIEDEGKIIDIPTKNIDLNIASMPACLNLHNIDVIVRIRTLKEKNIN